MLTSPLIRFTLDGLSRCFMPERGLWSFKYHLDGRRDANESRPEYDIFYSLNVLLGLSRLPSQVLTEAGLDPRGLLPEMADKLLGTGVPRYAYGMALWAAAELAVPVPGAVLDRVLAMTASRAAMRGWTAQDLGLLLCGAVAQSRSDPAWTRLARTVRDIILDDLLGPSSLFRDRTVGVRRFFGSFATQVYCVLGLYQYSNRFGDDRAGHVADRCVERLIALQGPQGEWPWFYEVKRGRVLDYYEVYSVHQHGMAPAILKPAMRRGVPGAKTALAKGFRWILGQNHLGRTMLYPDLSLVARSQARRGWTGGRAVRLARSALLLLLARTPRLGLAPDTMVVTPEVRSYELGWTLWSFGDDTELHELTHDDAFGTDAAPVLTPEVAVPGASTARAPSDLATADAIG